MNKTTKSKPRIGTKGKVAKILLELGESHRSTAEKLGISVNTVTTISKQQILSDAELNVIERENRQTAVEIQRLYLQELKNNKTKIRKAKASELAVIIKAMDAVKEGNKPEHEALYNTLVLAKYGRKQNSQLESYQQDKEGTTPQDVVLETELDNNNIHSVSEGIDNTEDQEITSDNDHNVKDSQSTPLTPTTEVIETDEMHHFDALP